MELDLGCREDVEVRECFSSPEILKLKAQCELARYHVAEPNRLQCPFGLAGPVFKVVSQYLCVEGVINYLSLRYKFFVHNAMAVEKNSNHGFHPGSAHACVFRMRRTFRLPFLTLLFGLGIVSRTPMIHLLLL